MKKENQLVGNGGAVLTGSVGVGGDVGAVAGQAAFTRYQTFIIVVISLLQFTVILDFMVMAPLGAQLIRILKISPSQFGWVVSVYAFSAGISGILAAGFADRFDRKKMLLFFYTGFIVGTLLCGMATGYYFLLGARMVTGLFGGVLFSTNMAIVADLFALEKRGRVMGFVQMAFAVSQVAGIPVGLFFANNYGWHMPFLMIVGLCVPVGIVIWRWMKPVTQHLVERKEQRPLAHLVRTASQGRYLRAFAATALLSTGGFLMMPYSSTFLVHNVGIDEKVLPIVFMVAGFVGLFTGPLIGKLSDRIGKFRMFLAGSVLATLMVPAFTYLSITPLWEVLILNTLLYTAVFSRMIPSQALLSAVPDAKDRGAFMSINSSVQQLGGGIASVVGGWIIAQNAAGLLVHYDLLGWVTIGAFFGSALLMYAVNSYVISKTAAAKH
ncbi:MAG: MFS transporter [Bacteroidetes bacterium]|nr:MFS transporter [Bacteroidota bacterium]